MQVHPPCSPKAFSTGVLVLGLVLLGAQPPASQRRVTISGQVRTEQGQVIPSGVTVLLQMFDGTRIAELHADSQGCFEIPNLVPVNYTVTVIAEGFYTAQQIVNLAQSLQEVNVQMMLTRRPQTKRADEVLPALTDMNLSRKARKAFEKGVQALEAKNLSEARGDFQKAIGEFPCYARAQTGLAAVFSATQQAGAAEAALRKAIQCDPGFPDAYASLGQILNNEGRLTESEALLSQGLRLSPRAWQLYDKLAAIHYSSGQYAKAEEEWLRVESLDPTPASELHAKLAAVYVEEGKNDKAYDEMQAYLRADAEGRFAGQMRMLMRRIESARTKGSAQPGPLPLPPEGHEKQP